MRQALANAIETLMKDRDLRLRFGRAGRQLVVDEFSSVADRPRNRRALWALDGGRLRP